MIFTCVCRYFSNLGTATLGLWECISGGMDWQDMAQPLIDDVSPLMALVFSGYVAFSMLAMMNVITGIFVDNAKTYAQQDKERSAKLKSLLKGL